MRRATLNWSHTSGSTIRLEMVDHGTTSNKALNMKGVEISTMARRGVRWVFLQKFFNEWLDLLKSLQELPMTLGVVPLVVFRMVMIPLINKEFKTVLDGPTIMAGLALRSYLRYRLSSQIYSILHIFSPLISHLTKLLGAILTPPGTPPASGSSPATPWPWTWTVTASKRWGPTARSSSTTMATASALAPAG